ncbi:MAG: SURF1 family protein, partial [Pseudomonadota bacterium]
FVVRLDGTNVHVLVARGWLPRDPAQRDRIAPYATPSGTVTIDGIVKATMGHVMQLGEAAPLKPGTIVQNIDPAQLARASGLALQPFVLEQGDSRIDTLVRDWPAPNLGVEKHQGYAFQWYALAVMALLFFVITGFKREPN